MKKRVILGISILLLLLLFSLSVSAKLYITSYCDVSLESCASQDQALALLENDYPHDIEVSYLYYFDTSDPDSSLAQIAVECANREGMKDAYKSYLEDHLSTEISRDSLKADADAVGLAAANFTFCLDTQETAYDVLNEIENAEEEGVTTVPSVRFGTDIYTGSQTFTSLHTLVQQYLNLSETESPAETTASEEAETTSSSSTSSKPYSKTPSKTSSQTTSSEQSSETGAEEMQNIEQPLFFRVIGKFRIWMLDLFSQ